MGSYSCGGHCIGRSCSEVDEDCCQLTQPFPPFASLLSMGRKTADFRKGGTISITKTKTKTKPSIQLKRAYEPPGSHDGPNFLVERLWPRGVKKKDLAIDAWLKDVAPSAKLRTWFSHDPAKWDEFRRR